MNIELIKRQLLTASRALVSAERVCIYAVDAELTPYDHLTEGGDPSWVHIYSQFRDIDPFHPRYFAQNKSNVFRTQEACGPAEYRNTFISGFRQAMGIQYKAEVFLRDRSDRICGGIRFSRTHSMGDFQENEIATLNMLQPVFSNAWISVLREERERSVISLLTDREQDVLELLLKGLPNKLICRELNVALPTVKNHVKNILRKTKTTNRSEMIARLHMM
jgi:DNA-binding CsgD family transcriptional regulator